jgi:hypothetical protein
LPSSILEILYMPQPYSEKTGKLIDTWIRLRRTIDNYQRSVTDYINLELAVKANLSGRQIERMRRYDGFPEDKAIIKLIEAIPDLKSLDCSDFLERLLLPFTVVEQAQSRIKAPQKGDLNTIVIISGWAEPLGITQDEIAHATTKNISGDFEYIFLYPDPQTYPEDDIPSSDLDREEYIKAVLIKTDDWIDSFRLKCEGVKYTELSRAFGDREKIRAESQEFEKSTKERISRIHSNKDNNKFWSLLPSNYTVLYNPDKPKGSGYDRYGVFRVKGKLVEFSQEILDREEINKNFTNSSSGWLYINDEQFEELAELFLKVRAFNKKIR